MRTLSEHHPGNGQWFRIPGYSPAVSRAAVYNRDKICAYCGRPMLDGRCKPRDITLDHLVSRHEYASWSEERKARFGSVDKPSNIVLACRSCNSARGCKAWRKYATGGAIERIERMRRRKLNLELARSIVRGEVTNPDLESR